jgi:carbonic anhydrase/acetyltransferase-like protein (isoleucine patch superfamily)
MALYALDDIEPQVHPTAWVADSATVIGDVVLEEGASVWYGAVLRGDTERITIGRGSNVQDGCVLHTDRGFPLTLGAEVTIGHQVVLHGCTVGDGSLVGIQAVVLNGAVIGRGSLVAAGAIVTEGKTFPDHSLIMGAPAKVVREISPEQAQRMARGAGHYVDNAQRHRRGLRRLDEPSSAMAAAGLAARSAAQTDAVAAGHEPLRPRSGVAGHAPTQTAEGDKA